ncbi:uncharacterized protein LAESUDRAFT_725000 [Laetiporus sulphureus 93-53]|uniref:VPS9 domain-containing protein n=1 Tax=Laetiporus sulphureus 93-53 TaxID=1314785 RepID=A0A165EQA3_9APHY|nr:uncharacterized protein LAESUDRAFT_725000 [Laetiporus sulphureus 93-53]KZT07540.1 hypothetical protein LAESUDRAFT_725000 [Laetiporus sulphureus 93-53]
MSSTRDTLFPPASIGRTSSPVPRVASHENLPTHPLLSPPAPSSPTSATFIETATSGPPRYVPYTPRQRVVPTSATTGATMHPNISPQQQQSAYHGDATSKLQLMNLKAAAQRIGLDAGSTGWAILERLGSETDHGPEWNDIWNALSVSKATLLLPTELHRPSDPITPELIKDHIALCDSSSKNGTAIVTLSGIRGTLADHTLAFRSSISPESESFLALLSPSKRSSTFALLPPLPNPLVQPSSPAPPSPSSSVSSIPSALPRYPSFTNSSHVASLPLPPRPSVPKPPLPPRPGTRAASGPPNPTSRLSNPFASLFGRAAPSASPSTTPILLHPETAMASSISTPSSTGSGPSTSSLSQAGSTASPGGDRGAASEHSVEVTAYAISKTIDRASLGRALTDAITGEMRAALWDAHVPPWAVERVERFSQPLFPMSSVGASGAVKEANGRKVPGVIDTTTAGRTVSSRIKSKADSDAEWSIASGVSQERADELADKFQGFYAELEDMLWERLPKTSRKHLKGNGRNTQLNEKKGSGNESMTTSTSEGGSDVEESMHEKAAGETEEDHESGTQAEIQRIMNAVERVLCSLFYDRLFCPASTDDASHDETLSSRIAAVNVLDLGLAHLGVDVGDSGKQVEAVIGDCGRTLMQLDTARRSPAEKAAVLVSIHKVIVDGLSRLPPIELKSEEELLDDKTPRAGSFGRKNPDDDHADDDDDGNDTTLKERARDDTDNLGKPEPSLLSPAIVLSPEDANGSNKQIVVSSSHEQTVSADGDRTLHSPTETSSQRVFSPVRSSSPLLTATSRTATPTQVSGDVILPLMIFAVVKANPPRLVSNLLYIQRFRRESAGGGEEGYCLINLMAVAEFLENVDLAALGLGESGKTVLSPSQLSPIPLARSVRVPGAESVTTQVAQASLRGRVEQQVDAIAGSANKVISGVVDTSFGVLRSLLPGQNQGQGSSTGGNTESTEESASRPGFGILRRDTGFSIASLAASLPGSRTRSASTAHNEESGQQMVEVPSRPGSSRSMHVDEELTASDEQSSGDEDEGDEEDEGEHGHDTRSIRSFESMMSGRTGRRKGKRRPSAPRKSLTDRLANMPGLSRLSQNQPHDVPKLSSPPASRRSSLLIPTGSTPYRYDSPVSSRAASPIAIRISPPNSRFLTCTEDDIKVSEVGELLREYKRLAEAVRAMGGFQDE